MPMANGEDIKADTQFHERKNKQLITIVFVCCLKNILQKEDFVVFPVWLDNTRNNTTTVLTNSYTIDKVMHRCFEIFRINAWVSTLNEYSFYHCENTKHLGFSRGLPKYNNIQGHGDNKLLIKTSQQQIRWKVACDNL